MNRFHLSFPLAGVLALASLGVVVDTAARQPASESVVVHAPAGFDISPPLTSPGAAGVEQTAMGDRPPVAVIASFDGLGHGFVGPQGSAVMRNPSDNTLAVGPDHIVEIVNSRMAIYSRRGEAYDSTGRVLYGPVTTNTIFTGFGGRCEPRPNGDAVVRYDQLAQRWLYVMPIFRRDSADAKEPYSMCYAVSAGPDPLGPYYRYEFKRSLFPDYPRPAIWPDGYYVPTSTGDDVIEKHTCIVDRTKMLRGEAATEQCIIIKDVNFLNHADIDGQALPPAGAPNIMMAAGGTQLRQDFDDDAIYVWKVHVDWANPANTRADGPARVAVAPYHYLCDGQLTRCVPQPGTDIRLDAQGDKLMSRLVYRNIDGHESIVASHSVNTTAGGGGVRWYEFRLNQNRDVYVHQQGTYAPDGLYRWMGSIAMDRAGNIGVGYSFGGLPHFAGQRFAARLATDPPGLLTFRETVLVHGAAAQTNTLRWEDYTTTAMDPLDDCTIWYVGDYLKAGAPSYTTRIGAFRIPGCLRGTVSGSAFFDSDHDGVRDPGEPGIKGARIRYTGGQSGEVTADANGRFRALLPADPLYGSTTYSLIQDASSTAGWTRTGRNTFGRRAVSLTPSGYLLRLNDRADVSLDFGNVCVVKNTGGAAPAFWASPEGATVVAAVRSGDLRKVIAATAGVVKADGNAFAHDPVQGDWLPVSALIARVGAFIAAHPSSSTGADRATALKYVTTLDQLNRNAALVTPADPARCAQAFSTREQR